jgi:hypothetical protein
MKDDGLVCHINERDRSMISDIKEAERDRKYFSQQVSLNSSSEDSAKCEEASAVVKPIVSKRLRHLEPSWTPPVRTSTQLSEHSSSRVSMQ